MSLEKRYNYLIAEDEFSITKIISEMLSIHPSTAMVYTAKNGLEALDIYKENDIDIVITDILMPEFSGIELIKEIKKINADAQIIVESAFSDIDLVREAMRSGAYDYVLKPFTIDDLMLAVDRLIERIKFITERNNYIRNLEKEVKSATEQLQKGFVETLSALVYALSVRDKYVHTHSLNVAEYSKELGRLAGLSKDKLQLIETAGLVHDIGKIAIPDGILNKPGRLNEEEYSFVKTHPVVGKNIIYPSMYKKSLIINFVYSHHERYDGKGYPEGVAREKIPFEARIACIADSYDSMVTDRVYRSAMSIDQAIEELKANVGKQFDPGLVKLFIEWIEKNQKK